MEMIFFSPCLMEADLMRRVFPKDDYYHWVISFLTCLKDDPPHPVYIPAIVSDRSDPKIVHLDGLNLSRAWCMMGIASVLPAHSPQRATLIASAMDHAQASLPYIMSGSYAGEHWLASFAVYMFTLFMDF